MKYDFDKQADDHEDFILGGHTYRLRMPSLDEVLELGDLGSGSSTPEDTKKIIDKLVGFVEPVSDGAPAFREALGNSSVKKLNGFMQMVQTEFGALEG